MIQNLSQNNSFRKSNIWANAYTPQAQHIQQCKTYKDSKKSTESNKVDEFGIENLKCTSSTMWPFEREWTPLL